jgi:hypothetical protein
MVFDLDDRLAELSAKGDSLERVQALVDFQMFRVALEAAVPRADRSKGGRPASKSNMPATRLAFTGRAARKVTRSRAKEPPNFSTTAPSRSSSNTETATKPSLKPNGILLQQPASVHCPTWRAGKSTRSRDFHSKAKMRFQSSLC